jgi:hypothetical protein
MPEESTNIRCTETANQEGIGAFSDVPTNNNKEAWLKDCFRILFIFLSMSLLGYAGWRGEIMESSPISYIADKE